MTESKKYYRQWATCYATLGDDFSCISLDLGYLRLLPVPDKRNTLRVLVPVQAPDEDRIPSNDELIVLTRIGDALNESLNTTIDASYIGFIAADKQCGFYFCIGATSIQEQIVDETMRQFPEYPHEIHIIEGDDWAAYTECLFPAHQYYERINDSSVVTRLEKNGVSLTKPRSVDHWCYFRDESDRSRFVEKVGSDGFLVEDLSEDHQYDGGEYPYGVHLSRVDMVDRQNLFKYTSYLWNLAYEHYGIYDGWGTLGEKEEHPPTGD